MGAKKAIVIDTGKFDIPEMELEQIVKNPEIELFTTAGVLGEINRWKSSPNYAQILSRENNLRAAARNAEDLAISEDFQDLMTYQKIVSLEDQAFKANPNVARMLTEALSSGLELDLSHLPKKDAKAVRTYLDSASLREVYSAHNIIVDTEGAGIIINPEKSGQRLTISLKKATKKGKGNAAERLIAGAFSDPKAQASDFSTQLKQHYSDNGEFYADFTMAQNVIAYFKRNGKNIMGYNADTDKITQVAGLSSKSLMSDMAQKYGIERLRGRDVPAFIAACDAEYLNRVREMKLFVQEGYDHSKHGDVIEKLERAAIRCISKGGLIRRNNERTDVNLVANALYNTDLKDFQEVELRTLDNDVAQMTYFGKLQAEANLASVNNVTCRLYRPRDYMIK